MGVAVDYLAPDDLHVALDRLAEARWVVLAGGTDLYPAHVGRPLSGPILDIGRLEALKGIREDGGYFRIGALTTWTDILRADLPPAFRGLKLAAREVGAVQIQNAGTVGGNLCNASPAADGVPPLLALEAVVELASRRGTRRLPLAEFILGNRRTAKRPDELLTAVLVPKALAQARSDFLKLGSRSYLVISIVMVAATVTATDDGRVAAARVAVGACSPVARRLPALEARLAGVALDGRLGEAVTGDDIAALSPIDDVRASAAYRLEAAEEMIRRVLNRIGGGTA